MGKMLFLKFLTIGMLTFVIMIALYLISDTIASRQKYRDDAVTSIASSYAAAQTIVGPVLVRPYKLTVDDVTIDDKGVRKITTRTTDESRVFFPQQFELSGVLTPSERHHGLYKVPVYEAQIHLAGHIAVQNPILNGKMEWGQPYLALAVGDVRGIVGMPKMLVNGTPVQIFHGAPSMRAWQPNLRVPLQFAPGELPGDLTFSLDMVLAGTEQLSIAPVGDSNHIELTSTWPSPLFAGRFLPRTRQVSGDGFKATWDISSLASATQLQLMASEDKGTDLLDVSLVTPIDSYKLSDRAVKYGILFILLTFAGFFTFEMMKHLPIHPVQYLLVGFGLSIFFLLLISFSEHMPFAVAYLLASAACIGLLTFYLSYVLRGVTRGFAFGALLTLLYSVIYGLLISEDNALMLGSLLLFAVLAAMMYVTRKVDWYAGSTKLMQATEQVPPPPPPTYGSHSPTPSQMAPPTTSSSA